MTESEEDQQDTWWKKHQNTVIGWILFAIFIISVLYLWFPYANNIGPHRKIILNDYSN